MWNRTDPLAPTTLTERQARLARLRVPVALQLDIAARAGDHPFVGSFGAALITLATLPMYLLALVGVPWVFAKKSAERHSDGLFATTILFPALASIALIFLAARAYGYYRRDPDTDAKAVAQQLCSVENVTWNRLRLWLADATQIQTADQLLASFSPASAAPVVICSPACAPRS